MGFEIILKIYGKGKSPRRRTGTRTPDGPTGRKAKVKRPALSQAESIGHTDLALSLRLCHAPAPLA